MSHSLASGGDAHYPHLHLQASCGIYARRMMFALTLVLAAAHDARAQAPIGAQFLANIGSNASRIQFAPGRPDELFISRLNGELMRLDLTDNSVTQFADVSNVVTNGYRGFIGFTFAPDFQTTGNLYVNVADDVGVAPGVDHRAYIRRYTLADPNAAAATLGTPTTISRFDRPGFDHNGGVMGFRPGGDPNQLFITTGDGINNDANNDPFNNGQDRNVLLGKILRLDVSADAFPGDENRNYSIAASNPFATGGGAPEVWAYGLRNPWAGSFDRQTGDLIIADVGQSFANAREEIDLNRADDPGGANYGWRVMEGTAVNDNSEFEGNPPGNDPSFTNPIYEYVQSGSFGGINANEFSGRAVIGGNIYRGPIPELQGKYFFGDFISRQVWSMEIDRDANAGRGGIVPGSLANWSTAFERKLQSAGAWGDGVASFGEDQHGNVYFVELDGDLFRIGPTTVVGPAPIGPSVELRDDFGVSHNYATGALPAAGIWNGVRNPTNGGTAFNAHTLNPGHLTVGSNNTGWEGNGRDNARFLFREVDAADLAMIEIKISAQSVGNWSSAGILVRAPGPIDGNGANDNFMTAASFRPSQTGMAAQLSNVTDGTENEANAPVDSAEDLAYLRLVNSGDGLFDFFTSTDGQTWISRGSATNTVLGTGILEVGVWAGTFATLGGASAQFDYVAIREWGDNADFDASRPEDLTGDGDVDGDDFLIWQQNLGLAPGSMAAPSGAGFAQGDANGDRVVDAADLAIWRSQFGAMAGGDAASLPGNAVPEPKVLAGLGLIAMLVWHRAARARRFA